LTCFSTSTNSRRLLTWFNPSGSTFMRGHIRISSCLREESDFCSIFHSSNCSNFYSRHEAEKSFQTCKQWFVPGKILQIKTMSEASEHLSKICMGSSSSFEFDRVSTTRVGGRKSRFNGVFKHPSKYKSANTSQWD